MTGDIYHWEETEDRGYSIGWNMETLIKKGIPDSEPPLTLKELLKQTQVLISKTDKEWGGPITLNSFDNYISSFVEKEKTSKKQIGTQIEKFLTTISKGYDVTISLDLIPKPDYNASVETQITLDFINRVILDKYVLQMTKGIFEPKIIINLYKNTDWKSDILDQCFKISYLFGQPIYQNFNTGTIRPETLKPRKNNPDYNITYLRTGGAIGNSENQSVLGYSCINLEKIATQAWNEEVFFELLEKKVNEAIQVSYEKQRRIEKRLSDGDMPLTAHFIESLDWSFSVITLVGMNEALETLIDASLSHVAGKAVTYKVLEYILEKLERAQITTGRLFSLESYPSENPGSMLSSEYNSIYPYFTASTELKPSHGDDLWDVLEHQKKYHSMYTGGTLQQIHLKKGIQYSEGLKLIIKRTLEVFGYNYVAITPIFSLCSTHGYIFGEQTCSKCNSKVETFTRVDSKITKVSELSIPLKEAYKQRVYYDIKNA
jgi:ribonucleoside-triphosphate reductase